MTVIIETVPKTTLDDWLPVYYKKNDQRHFLFGPLKIRIVSATFDQYRNHLHQKDIERVLSIRQWEEDIRGTSLEK